MPMMTNKRASLTEFLAKDAKLKCQNCERVFNSKQNLSYHTKSQHEGVMYIYNQCDYQATTQGSLRVHILAKHEGVKYACNQCDYQATTPGNLRKHIKKKHEDADVL